MYPNRKINYVFDGIDLPPLLSEEDTIKYLHLAKNGDLYARNMLIKHNIRIITTIIHAYYGYDNNATVSDEDLVSEGVFTIIEAIENFDFDMGLTFKCYLKPCIRHIIKNKLSRVKSYDMSLEETLDNNNGDEDFSLLRALDTGENVEEKGLLSILRQNIEEALSFLDDIDRQIIILSFGLYNREPLSASKVAKIVKISKTGGLNHLKTAKKKLRWYFENKLFYDENTIGKQKQLAG